MPGHLGPPQIAAHRTPGRRARPESENLQNTAGVTRSGTIRAEAHGCPPYAISDRQRVSCGRTPHLLRHGYRYSPCGIHGFGRSTQYPLPSPVPKKNCGCAPVTGEGTISEVAGRRGCDWLVDDGVDSRVWTFRGEGRKIWPGQQSCRDGASPSRKQRRPNAAHDVDGPWKQSS